MQDASFQCPGVDPKRMRGGIDWSGSNNGILSKSKKALDFITKPEPDNAFVGSGVIQNSSSDNQASTYVLISLYHTLSPKFLTMPNLPFWADHA